MWVFLENIAQENSGKKLFVGGASSDEWCRAARDFLRLHKLWMRDVLQTYQRNDGKECSPSDRDIVLPKSEHCTDFRAIFERIPLCKWSPSRARKLLSGHLENLKVRNWIVIRSNSRDGRHLVKTRRLKITSR